MPQAEVDSYFDLLEEALQELDPGFSLLTANQASPSQGILLKDYSTCYTKVTNVSKFCLMIQTHYGTRKSSNYI